jgi:heme-degrading monooxygenase HmoA
MLGEIDARQQDEVVNLMIERARFMATQPGFVSIALHRSKDGSHVVNYVQWRDAESCLYDLVPARTGHHPLRR